MRFLIDSMLPPLAAHELSSLGHDAVTPTQLGAHNLPDNALVEIAAIAGYVIVTENASDFAHVATCPVLFVRKSWWPQDASLPSRLAGALDRWSKANPNPGPWIHWLDAELR